MCKVTRNFHPTVIRVVCGLQRNSKQSCLQKHSEKQSELHLSKPVFVGRTSVCNKLVDKSLANYLFKNYLFSKFNYKEKESKNKGIKTICIVIGTMIYNPVESVHRALYMQIQWLSWQK